MKTEIMIRRAAPDDAIQLAELAVRGMPGYPFESIYDPKTLRAEIENSDNRVVAVDPEKKIVGTAVLGDGHMAEIKRVLVDPEKRGAGLGHLLTSSLKAEAKKRGVVPWADVRADQIGMQKAAYKYDLTLVATSIEAGKHVVYSHKNNQGPARESMVHMSGLPLATERGELNHLLNKWPHSLVNQLVCNITKSLTPPEKDHELVVQIVPSARKVKRQIEDTIRTAHLASTELTADILLLQNDDATCLIITPDASGFVEGEKAEHIAELVNTALSIGLQIVTCYVALSDTTKINALVGTGMEPTMIRPWQESAKTKPQWQVGMRKTGNHYDKSLHEINLDPWVQASIMSMIEKPQGNEQRRYV